MVAVIYYIFFSIVAIYSVYFAITGLFVFKKPKIVLKDVKDKTKFAILIPARNEEKVIEELIKSINNQDYNKDLYDVYVLVNNCTDKTPKIALLNGANVIEIPFEVSGKGEVLRYAFDELKNKKFDAYLVFDADNVVKEDFFHKMNNAYQNGYKVAQGRKDSKNISDNWISCSYSLFYYIQNYFYNKSRTNINGYATINGTGFMVDKSIVEDDFNPKTITEDIELSIFCMLKNEQIIYIDDAITYDEQPTKFVISWHQRARWSKGIIQCCKYYMKDLFKLKKCVGYDKIIFIIAPYFQILSLILTIMLTVFNIVGYELHDIFSYVFNSGWIALVLFYMVGVLFNIIILKIYKQKIFKNMHGILLFGVFIISWVFINIECIFKKEIKWVQINHNKSMSLDEINK